MQINLKKLHILVIEDILPMQQLIVQMLQTLGVGSVSSAENGDKGYDLYLNTKPDIIITDWNMPEMDGLDFIKKVRLSKESPNRTVPIIMITGYCSKKRISLARDNGCTEFIVKPFSANDIAARIAHIIRKPRDFILMPQFAGPDRRRRKDDNYEGETNRKQDTHKRIKAKKVLEQKTGTGYIAKDKINNSQRVLEENNINFVPIAKGFLADLENVLAEIKEKEISNQLDLENIINPIMQIKANALIFKYELVGNLADIILNFLENINQIDEFVIEIVTANKITMHHLLDNEIRESNESKSPPLEEELANACKRYINTKMHISKHKLQKLNKT